MSINAHYLDNHLDNFPENLAAYSEEQGERFHQDLKVMKDRYQGRCDEHMMADYCWSIARDCAEVIDRRRSEKRSLLFRHLWHLKALADRNRFVANR